MLKPLSFAVKLKDAWHLGYNHRERLIKDGLVLLNQEVDKFFVLMAYKLEERVDVLDLSFVLFVALVRLDLVLVHDGHGRDLDRLALFGDFLLLGLLELCLLGVIDALVDDEERLEHWA